MALITCPECGGKISDEADVCIHCGYPFKKYTEYIDYKQIPHKSDVYNIEIYCSKKFNPKEMGNNSDDRDLAIRIKYIGN